MTVETQSGFSRDTQSCMDTEIKTESSTPAPQDINAHEEVPPTAPKIRGFLIVVAVGLVLSFLQNLGDLGWSLVPLRGETWRSSQHLCLAVITQLGNRF